MLDGACGRMFGGSMRDCVRRGVRANVWRVNERLC